MLRWNNPGVAGRRRGAWLLIGLSLCVLAACDGGDGSVKTPPPTATWTPTPPTAVVLPAVESGSGLSGDQLSPLATPDAASPLPSPTSTPTP